MNAVTIIEAAQILAQLAQTIQAAIAAGQTTIDGPTFAAAIATRDADLAKLDSDIKGAGG